MVKAQLKKTVNMNTTIYGKNKTKEDNQLQDNQYANPILIYGTVGFTN